MIARKILHRRAPACGEKSIMGFAKPRWDTCTHFVGPRDDSGACRQFTRGIVRVCSTRAACQRKTNTHSAFHAVPGVALDLKRRWWRACSRGTYSFDVFTPRWPCSDPAGECAKDYSSPCPADWVEDGVHCKAPET